MSKQREDTLKPRQSQQLSTNQLFFSPNIKNQISLFTKEAAQKLFQTKKGGFVMSKKLLTGIDQISEYTGLSHATIMELTNFYDLPLENHSENDSVWRTSTKQLENWLNEIGLKTWDRFSIARAMAAKLRKMRRGPGKVIVGDMMFICDELRIAVGTFIDLSARTDNPIKRLPDSNEYEIDLNRWGDFLETLARESRGSR